MISNGCFKPYHSIYITSSSRQTEEAMASRRSHAPSHSRNANLRRVPRGHVSIRNPLQAPKERSCGISIVSHSLGSAKRDQQLILNQLAFVGA